jgi:hypothetical protein
MNQLAHHNLSLPHVQFHVLPNFRMPNRIAYHSIRMHTLALRNQATLIIRYCFTICAICSWDYIYAEYIVASGDHHRSIVWQIAEDYSHCDILLRLPGYCPSMFICVFPILSLKCSYFERTKLSVFHFSVLIFLKNEFSLNP